MRKNTTFSRSLLLTAALAFSTATLTAQVTAVDSKVTDLAHIVDGGTYAIKIYPVNGTEIPEPVIEYPFETSTVSGTEWTGSEHWYTLLTRGTYWAYNAETSKIDLNAATPDLNDDAYLWAIAGNADDGFKIYNKAAGPQVVLTVTDGNAVDMLQGEGTAMLIAKYPSGGSTAMPGGWCISVPGTNQFLNKQDKDKPQDGLSELWIWDSTGAGGRNRLRRDVHRRDDRL